MRNLGARTIELQPIGPLLLGKGRDKIPCCGLIST